ncbi:hypothetical protein ACFX12_011282 [Malus domestica]
MWPAVECRSPHDHLDEQDAAYIGELFKSVQMVTDAMEALVKRVLLAQSEIDSDYELQKTNRRAASFGRLLTSVHVGL